MNVQNLMKDPVYRSYMKRVPTLPAHSAGKPWKLWVHTPEDRWLTKDFGSYREVWPVFIARMKAGHDVTIVSKRLFFAPPGEYYSVRVKLRQPTPSGTTHRVEERWRQTFEWPDIRLQWCGRCRRPVRWARLRENHHALRTFPVVTEEDNMRCTICGIRRLVQPPVDQMVRI